MNDKLINLWDQGFIPHHTWLPCNIEVEWWDSDSLENFEKSSNNYYNKDSITYRFNNYGYRGIDFDTNCTKPKILCLGCSITFGIGLPENEIWLSHIQSYFPSHIVYNLGIPGGSPDTVTRILTNCCNILNPKLVLILWPSKNRFETYKDPKDGYITPHGPWSLTKENCEFFHNMESYNQFEKNRILVKLLKSTYNFNLQEINIDDYNDTFSKQLPLARDMAHYGPQVQKNIANMFIDKLNVS